MPFSRRDFGRIAAGTAVSAVMARTASHVPIAVQLYSVRQIAEKDLSGVLQSVAKTGYKGVEFAGYYGHSADDIRRMLDANQLRVAGSHVGLDAVLGDQLAKTMAFNKTIGNRNLIVPGFAPKYHASPEAWKEAARLLDEAAVRARAEGFVVGYHNHSDELKPDSKIPLDVFFATAPNVRVQLDIGHVARAGAKPEQILRQYRDRLISVHVKEFQPGDDNAVLGEGVIDWKNVFRELDDSPGLEWLIVEEEGDRCSGFTCIDKSHEVLTKKMHRS